MGSSQSSRRRRQQHHQNVPPRQQQQQQQEQQQSFYPAPGPPRWGNSEPGPCPHLSPYYYHHSSHHSSPPFLQHGYYVPPGQFIAPPPSPPPPPPPPPPHHSHALVPYGFAPAIAPASAPAPAPAVVPEYQKASTVRNDVNLNKGTLRLERNESNPEHHLVAFSFDATEAGSISVFFLACEAPDGSVASISKAFPPPRRTHFKSGLGQKFREETGLDFSLIDEEDLGRVGVGAESLYPLIIRIETVAKEGDSAAEAQELDADAPGGALTKRVNCQQTYAVILRKDNGEFDVKVVKQIIWVDAVRYELQEIFGIASSNEVNNSNSDSGKECVICLSEPKDTTLLPCRHMCMCSECANVLRYQSNLCPICRCPVEELIQIKVPE